ncbi:MAG: alpha-isopropylmalate synthase regulatory domain-containing protein [Nanoarchaeota archaeon]
MSELEIYDTTLREGEQAAGANFDIEDRKKICTMLDELGVDYIELGWPVASKEIFDSFAACLPCVKKAEITAFGSTSISKDIESDLNLNSIVNCGAKITCIFGKSHLEHVERQLKITPEENLERIFNSVKFLKDKGIRVFYDAEHYFDAFKQDKNYAIKTLVKAVEAGAERLVLCDTNGGVLPEEAEEIVRETKKQLEDRDLKFEIGLHFHDDSGLALANTLSSLKYAKQVQGTINGIGERVGNLNFSEFLPVYIKKMKHKRNFNLKKLKTVNESVFRLGGLDIPESRAFVGESAFAHKGGVHTDATSKGASYEHENPEDFGNKRVIILNTLGGRACVVSVAKESGYELDKNALGINEKIAELFIELREMEKKGYKIGAIKAEQFLLIEKYFGDLKEFFKIEEWSVNTNYINGKEQSEFDMGYRIDNSLEEESLVVEGGPVDAAYKTIVKALKKKYPEIENLRLKDFHVSIAKSKAEESSVRTLVVFEDGEEFETVGVDSNIIQSAIEAMVKGFRYYLNKQRIKQI